jgi:polyisoprenoid-binding protein YceI
MRSNLIRLLAATAATFALAGTAATASPATLTIDLDHSSVAFSVRHLITRVHGTFRAFDGSILFDEEAPATSTVTATIRADSIDTNLATRDKDLRSERFFAVEKFPSISFTTRTVVPLSPTKFRVDGTLTMHGVSQPVSLETDYLGKAKDPWGNVRYAFHAVTTVSRKDFGMRWNEAVETGGFLVGDDIEITLDIDAILGH